MKKKLPALLLVLALLFAFAPGALSADAEVTLSTQGLKVNGVPIRCEKYNIDGYNYFKLRDLAFLLNGTGSQFSVDYDPVGSRVLVTPGKSYEPDGSELLYNGEDKSASASLSTQSLHVDGREVTDISVYNIGGNNYFQLRDLQELLNFELEYEASSRTILVRSLQARAPRELTPEEIYATCAPAVFYMEIFDEYGWCIKTGSGFFLSSDGLAVTNYHVISGADSAAITVSDTGKVYDVLGVYDYSAEEDWAVIQIDGSGFQTLEIGSPDYDVGGATVYAIGSPLGLQNTISQGIISNPRRLDSGMTYIQMSAAISPGSSGGALLNKYGQVIGITSATYTEGQNLNLSIPRTYLDQMEVEVCTPLSGTRSSPAGTLTLSAGSLDLSMGQEGTVTATAVEQNCSGVSVRYVLSREDIVSCSWGTWHGDNVDLTITPLAVGSAEISVYFVISETDTVLDSKTIQVTVTAELDAVSSEYSADLQVSAAELKLNLFESEEISIYAYCPENNEDTVVNRYISNPYVAECNWGKWEDDFIKLTVNPLSTGSTDIRIVYSMKDGTLLAEETVHVQVFFGLVTADTDLVTLEPGGEKTVVFSCVAQGGVSYSLRYDFAEDDIVSAKWGSWYENGTDCPLTFTGLKEGATEVVISMLDWDTKHCMATLRLPIQVS